MQDYEFWFVVGSQFLYGPEVLKTVAGPGDRDGRRAKCLWRDLPCPHGLIRELSNQTGRLLTWCVRQTIFPSALASLPGATPSAPVKCGSTVWRSCKSPGAIWRTQYNRDIPEQRDRHGLHESEPGGPRGPGAWLYRRQLRKARKIIAGYWQEEEVRQRLGVGCARLWARHFPAL